MATFRRKGSWLDWRECYTGLPPLANATGIRAQRIMNWLMNWRQFDMIAEYSGRVDKTINGNGDNDFYIISNSTVPADTGTTTRNLGIYIKCWDVSFAGVGLINVDWYDPHNAGAPQDLITYTNQPWSGVDDTAATKATGPEWFFYYDDADDPITYTPVTSGTADGFRLSRLAVDNATIATMGIWNMPSEELTDAEAQVGVGNVDVGETIRGYDGGIGTSLGALIELVGSGDDDATSLERHGRRCLFQTPWPVGSYHNNSGGYEAYRQDSNGNPWKYKVRTRNLLGASSGTQTCYPAIVLTADAGIDVRFTADSGDSWTYTVPGGGVTNQLVTYSDGTGVAGVGLEVDNDAADYVNVLVNAGVAEECTLQTVSLWEGPEY